MQYSPARFVGHLTLICRERTLGTNTFPDDGDVVDYEGPNSGFHGWSLLPCTTEPVSSFRNKPMCWSYADPARVPGGQGPLVVLGFPLTCMKQGSAVRGTGVQAMAKALRGWFLAHAPSQAGAGG